MCNGTPPFPDLEWKKKGRGAACIRFSPENDLPKVNGEYTLLIKDYEQPRAPRMIAGMVRKFPPLVRCEHCAFSMARRIALMTAGAFSP